jgi:hypothetical protein
LLLAEVAAWPSLGERETEPRWVPNKLANVSPANDDLRAWREEGEAVVFSSDMASMLVVVSAANVVQRPWVDACFLNWGWHRGQRQFNRYARSSCLVDSVTGVAVLVRVATQGGVS